MANNNQDKSNNQGQSNNQNNANNDNDQHLAEYTVAALLLIGKLSVDYISFYTDGSVQINLVGDWFKEETITNVDRIVELLNEYDEVKLEDILQQLKDATKKTKSKKQK